MNNSSSLEDEEEEEDALSLCDLALYSGEPENRRQTSSDAFEFSNDLTSDGMSHAEDIIHCGKLVPYKEALHDHTSRRALPARSNSNPRLTRNSSLVMKSEGSFSKAKSEGSKAGWKPKWYDLTFGLVKIPTEMDLRDIKNRQVRRNPVSSGRRSSWGDDLLRVLSCKNHPGSVAVTASIPQL